MFRSLTRWFSHLICMCNCKLIQNYVAQQMLEVSRMTCDLLSVHKLIFICMTPTFTVIHSQVLFVEQYQLTIVFRLLSSILYRFDMNIYFIAYLYNNSIMATIN